LRVKVFMDFMNRANRPAQPAPQPANNTNAQTPRQSNNDSVKKLRSVKGLKNPLHIVLLMSVAIVLFGMTWLATFYNPVSEGRHVAEDKLQAVFLEGGQVYFGRITLLNDQYVRLNDIYYLRVNQQVQPEQQGQQASSQDVSLVKLGCELHGPQDQMIINRAQVTFWENLKDDGQVAQAVAEYKEQNPDGQTCAQPGQDASVNGEAGGNGNEEQNNQGEQQQNSDQ